MTRELSEETLLDELQRVADELEEVPTVRQMREHGRYSPKTYKNRFGSWNEALAAGGWERRPRSGTLSKRELETEIRRLGEELGRAPTAAEMDALGAYSSPTYKNHFGSWNEAVTRVGFEPNRHDEPKNVRHVREHGVTPASELPGSFGVSDKRHGLFSFSLSRNASSGGGGSDSLGGMVDPVYYLVDEHTETEVVEAFFEQNPQILRAKTYHGLIQMIRGHGRQWRDAGKEVLPDLFEANDADPESSE